MSAFGGKADINRKLNVNLLRNCQGIIHVNAEVSNGAFDFPVTKQELDGA